MLSVLKPIWNTTPETASRLRGRIKRCWLLRKSRATFRKTGRTQQDGRIGLIASCRTRRGSATVVTTRRMPYKDVPSFMATLFDHTANRSQGARLRHPDRCTIRRSARRAVVRDRSRRQDVDCSCKPHEGGQDAPRAAIEVGAGDLARPDGGSAARTSTCSRPPCRVRRCGAHRWRLVLQRLGDERRRAHGMRASFRMWAADQGIAFEVAEQCLAHTVGSAVVQAYQRSSMLERRRPVLAAWADFVTGSSADDVVELRRTGA